MWIFVSMTIHLLNELTMRDSRACIRCLEAGYVKCLYPNSVQSDLPICEDEMAMQDLLDFDSTMGSDYIGGYTWKDLDVAPEDPHTESVDTCDGWVYNRTVDITGNTLDGQQLLIVTFYRRLTLIQGF
jgi:hypothetical protein